MPCAADCATVFTTTCFSGARTSVDIVLPTCVDFVPALMDPGLQESTEETSTVRRPYGI